MNSFMKIEFRNVVYKFLFHEHNLRNWIPLFNEYRDACYILITRFCILHIFFIFDLFVQLFHKCMKIHNLDLKENVGSRRYFNE